MVTAFPTALNGKLPVNPVSSGCAVWQCGCDPKQALSPLHEGERKQEATPKLESERSHFCPYPYQQQSIRGSTQLREPGIICFLKSLGVMPTCSLKTVVKRIALENPQRAPRS
jgi:hypothetical protein